MPNFLKSTPARVVAALLVLQGTLLYSSIRPEFVPSSLPLANVPQMLGNWTAFREGLVDDETQAVLQADDLLSRYYRKDNIAASLFVAAFRSQRSGKAPHSPKNCLPGSGWTPVTSDQVSINVGDRAIDVNRYIIESGESRSLVLYWYQSRDRVVASEYEAKLWVMADAIRYNRTDTALVRVIVDLSKDRNIDQAAAQAAAEDFVRSIYGPVRQHLPS